MGLTKAQNLRLPLGWRVGAVCPSCVCGMCLWHAQSLSSVLQHVFFVRAMLACHEHSVCFPLAHTTCIFLFVRGALFVLTAFAFYVYDSAYYTMNASMVCTAWWSIAPRASYVHSLLHLQHMHVLYSLMRVWRCTENSQRFSYAHMHNTCFSFTRFCFIPRSSRIHNAFWFISQVNLSCLSKECDTPKQKHDQWSCSRHLSQVPPKCLPPKRHTHTHAETHSQSLLHARCLASPLSLTLTSRMRACCFVLPSLLKLTRRSRAWAQYYAGLRVDQAFRWFQRNAHEHIRCIYTNTGKFWSWSLDTSSPFLLSNFRACIQEHVLQLNFSAFKSQDVLWKDYFLLSRRRSARFRNRKVFHEKEHSSLLWSYHNISV